MLWEIGYEDSEEYEAIGLLVWRVMKGWEELTWTRQGSRSWDL